MLEVEMKFPVEDFTAVEACLENSWAQPNRERQDVDEYFNAPDRDFAQTDEALRIRRIGPANYVTYKGPKRDTLTKTRTEIEVPFGPGDQPAADFRQVLLHLGYRTVAEVRKARRIYHVEHEGWELEVCLDEVEDLGCFVELELVVSEERFAEAREVLLRLAALLGLTTAERRSYLELLLARQGQPDA
jgi:adenylate cyclase class 2